MPGKMVEPGLVMFWFGADLFFANVTFFVEQARKLVHDSPSPVRWLVIDAPAITGLDFSTGRAVAELQQDHSRLDVDFRSECAVHRALVGNFEQPGALFRGQGPVKPHVPLDSVEHTFLHFTF
jgi:MFS superfamily sulfate permease-like transporter